MKTNISNPRGFLAFIPIDTQAVNIISGIGTWLDTDVSAITGVLTFRLWVITANGGGGISGARAHGETKGPFVVAANSVTVFSYVNGAGHMDLYQDVVFPCTYRFIGYFE